MANTNAVNEFDGLSDRVQLLLRRDEGADVDWKRNHETKVEDLVAFANAPSGGALLLGVAEIKHADGSTKPEIVGCKVDSNTKLEIINRAQSCVPPIDVEIIVENKAARPFLRVEIPSGRYKPYCTSAGLYRTRYENRNVSLLPTELLSIFLATEGRRFLDTFRTATTDLHDTIENLSLFVDQQMQSIESSLKDNVEELIGQIHDAMAGGIKDMRREAGESRRQIGDLWEMQYSLFRQLNLDTPFIEQHKATTKKIIQKEYANEKSDQQIIDAVLAQMGKHIKAAALKKWTKQMLDELKSRQKNKPARLKKK